MTAITLDLHSIVELTDVLPMLDEYRWSAITSQYPQNVEYIRVAQTKAAKNWGKLFMTTTFVKN